MVRLRTAIAALSHQRILDPKFARAVLLPPAMSRAIAQKTAGLTVITYQNRTLCTCSICSEYEAIHHRNGRPVKGVYLTTAVYRLHQDPVTQAQEAARLAALKSHSGPLTRRVSLSAVLGGTLRIICDAFLY